MLEAASSRTQR